MPNDFISLNTLVKELDAILKGARVDKINQPEPDEILLVFHTQNCKNQNLVISISGNAPRIHLTKAKKPNPLTSPQFCMFLRKYVKGGILENICTINDDRIVDITFSKKNEMLDTVKVHLIVEIMGRFSNIILADENFIIMQSLKCTSFDNDNKRIIAPRIKYVPLFQKKLAPSNYVEIKKILESFNSQPEPNLTLTDYILNCIGGFSKVTLENLLYVGLGDNNWLNINGLGGAENNSEGETLCSSLASCDANLSTYLADIKIITLQQIHSIVTAFETFINLNNSSLFNPSIVIDAESNVCDFFPFKPFNKTTEQTENFNFAVDSYFSNKDKGERIAQRAKSASKVVKNNIARLEKKFTENAKRLEDSSKLDEYKIKGELLLSNIYKLNKGDKVVEVNNYYNNTMLKINLDENLYPQQNVNRYFKTYTKLKRTGEVLTKMQEEVLFELNYFKCLKNQLEISTAITDIDEIDSELSKLNLKNKKAIKNAEQIKKEKNPPPLSPLMFKFNNLTIYVGKNNKQNDYLTFVKAKATDVWLHTKSEHGCHTIIENVNNLSLTDGLMLEAIKCAGELTAYYTNSQSGKTQVDYCFKKHVKRSPTKGLALANYVNYNTIVVNPINHINLFFKEEIL